jgi:hypothetical protein
LHTSETKKQAKMVTNWRGWKIIAIKVLRQEVLGVLSWQFVAEKLSFPISADFFKLHLKKSILSFLKFLCYA